MSFVLHSQLQNSAIVYTIFALMFTIEIAKRLHLSPCNEILIEKLISILVSKFYFFKLCFQ